MDAIQNIAARLSFNEKISLGSTNRPLRLAMEAPRLKLHAENLSKVPEQERFNEFVHILDKSFKHPTQECNELHQLLASQLHLIPSEHNHLALQLLVIASSRFSEAAPPPLLKHIVAHIFTRPIPEWNSYVEELGKLVKGEAGKLPESGARGWLEGLPASIRPLLITGALENAVDAVEKNTTAVSPW